MLAVMAVPAAAQVVSFMGAGPVQLGMTVEAAERSIEPCGQANLPAPAGYYDVGFRNSAATKPN
jgi:hypothetical protein